KSLEIFAGLEEKTGFDIEWKQGGYTFCAYTEEIEEELKELVIRQKAFDLDIDWHEKEEFLDMLPTLNKNGLIGGTYSPGDGSASPMLAANAFYFTAKKLGAEFAFNEKVTGFFKSGDKITGVKTDKNNYHCKMVVNAAGAGAREIGEMLELDLPVYPDSHEGGVSAPVKRIFHPMVVDLRPGPHSSNFYFYQYKSGQLLFCITPKPVIKGKDIEHTSRFLPQISRRMIDLMPILKNINVRRTWRGLYPMTPDGLPIIGPARETEGIYNMVGMCGQGFMLGPGLGYYAAKDLTGALDKEEKEMLSALTLYRDFSA
ncbi:MAG: FAD-binding oxidoreductase, partial [bacterium]|nr:FAD-binding oxidoreductase [bacterium]